MKSWYISLTGIQLIVISCSFYYNMYHYSYYLLTYNALLLYMLNQCSFLIQLKTDGEYICGVEVTQNCTDESARNVCQ